MIHHFYTTSLSSEEFDNSLRTERRWNTGGSALLFLYRRYYRTGTDKNGDGYICPVLSFKKFRIKRTDERTVQVNCRISGYGIVCALATALCITLAVYFFAMHYSGAYVPEMPGEHGSYLGNGIYSVVLAAVTAVFFILCEVIPWIDVNKFLKTRLECTGIKKERS